MKSKLIRKLILEYGYKKQAGHLGSALSIVEILDALYFSVANINKYNASSPDRDIVILSKGHGSLALYCTLALKGIIPISYLDGYLSDDGKLPCHIDMTKSLGLEVSTGSLGHGLGLAEGICLANRINNIKSQIFVIIGDGEFQEGSVFESLLSVSSLCLEEITVILDNNLYQASAKTSDVVPNIDYNAIFSSLKFETFTIDGHNLNEIIHTLNIQHNRPKAIVANTLKGKGFSFTENKLESHYIKVNEELFNLGINELGLEE